MIIFRYLAKEVCLTLIALTAILMLIFLSNQFIQYLNRAASGSIPGVIIMKLMVLELPNLMSLLLPLGFYVALLIAYGRLYAENEMTVLRASGYGLDQLLKHSFILASVVAVLVAIIMIWASPHIATARAKLLRSAGIQTLIKTIMPGQFHVVDGGKHVFYVQSMSRDHSQAEHVFLAKRTNINQSVQWDILFADKAFVKSDKKNSDEYIILQGGTEYQGIPGQNNYQVAQFSEYKTRLPHPNVQISDDIRTLSTVDLLPFNNSDPEKNAELQWRLSVPFMVFTLALVAVPLSRVNSRSGKYAKLLPAVIIYIIYANLMFIARDALVSGMLPTWLGLWWVHLLVLILGLALIRHNQVKLA